MGGVDADSVGYTLGMVGMIYVERATHEDLLAIWELGDTPTTDPSLREKLYRAVEQRACLIARDSQTIVGYLLREPCFLGYPIITTIDICRDYLHKGVAHVLLEYAIQTNPADRLFATLLSNNQTHRLLFESMGFSLSGQVHHIHPTDLHLIYVKFLR